MMGITEFTGRIDKRRQRKRTEQGVVELDPEAKRVEGAKNPKEGSLLMRFSPERPDEIRSEP